MVSVPRLKVKREDLANFLRMYGEDELAAKALCLEDSELDKIHVLSHHYAFSDVAMDHGGSMGGARASALAALDVLEGPDRDLRRPRSAGELRDGFSPQLDESEKERIRALRASAPAR